MASNESTPARTPFAAVAMYYLTYGVLLLVLLGGLFLMWPAIMERIAQLRGAPALVPIATAVVRVPAPGPDSPPRTVATPIPGLAQNEATATAQYNEAVQRSQNGAVVLPANDPQPVQLVQQPAERMSAGDNVPTAEPVVEGAPVVNIQETHACKHGQTWTDAGCKNPDGKGTKVRP